MANEGANTPAVDAGDRTADLAQVIGPIVSMMATAQSEAARAQADAARAQVDGNVRLAELQHASARASMRQDFILRLLGSAVFIGVIGGGFYTGRFELVTHALTGAAGLVAGLGLGRASRP